MCQWYHIAWRPVQMKAHNSTPTQNLTLNKSADREHININLNCCTSNIYSPKTNYQKNGGLDHDSHSIYLGDSVIFCCLFWTVGPVSNTSTTWTTAPRCFSRISVLRFPSLGIQTVPKTKRSGSRRWRPEARMIAGYTNNTDLSKDGSLRGNSICSYFYGWALVGLLWATLLLKGDSTIPYTKNNPASIGTTLRDCHVKLGWWISCQAWWTSWLISKIHRILRDDILSHS